MIPEPTGAELRAEARAGRAAFRASPDSAFVREMREVRAAYQQARVEGVAREDACAGIEAVLRGAWPKPSTKFAPACELCEDHGWRYRECVEQMRCGARSCGVRGPEHWHTYVEPCNCEAGDRKRAKVRESQDVETRSAGKSRRKPRGWSAVGR